MTITLLLVLWEFLQTKFVSFMEFNLLVNLYFLVSFVISSLGTNWHESYLATSSSWWHHYLSFIYTPSKERLGMNQHESHTRTILTHFTFTFRENNSEYQDHMDITKCIPSIKISGLSLTDPLEKQAHPSFW